MSQTIANGLVVAFNYTLTNAEGEVLDASKGNAMSYLHGASNIVPGLEKQMEGRKVGDQFVAQVTPEEAYGVKQPEANQSIPKDSFGDATPKVGEQFATRAPNGQTIPLWIVGVNADTIDITFNHPLAGVALTFDVTVESIRDASDEEKAHGHPHGPGGHHH